MPAEPFSPHASFQGGDDDWAASLGTERSRVLETLSRLGPDVAQRIWNKDSTLWKPDGTHAREIGERLGWLTVASELHGQVDDLRAFAEQIRGDGYTAVVLLGMGGSSLCVEVLRDTFGRIPDYPEMHVLDTTDPSAVSVLAQQLDIPHTLFVVASKSGGTTETLSHYRFFYGKVQEAKGTRAGENFIAITDPGTSLEQIARDQGFRRTFSNPADIGGRYSVLSYFGLVPAALMGLDLNRLLGRAEAMMDACGPAVPANRNPGLQLGAAMGALAQAGKDKVTLDLPQPIASFGLWVEQLIAESTGKEDKGIVPISGERLEGPEVYGQDRFFVHLHLDIGDDQHEHGELRALEAAGHPVLYLYPHDAYDLGGEFFRWEFATAVAGVVLGIDAFDQPNVQESKDNTKRLLDQFQREGALPTSTPAFTHDAIAVYGDDVQGSSLQHALTHFLSTVGAGDYVAIMAYLPPSGYQEALDEIRHLIRDQHRVATTLGYGPRFLHSTGQLHKGGPNEVVALQIAAADIEDLAIPGEPYTFSTLFQAQSLGDFQSLQAHGRRALRLHLGRDIAAGLQAIHHALSN